MKTFDISFYGRKIGTSEISSPQIEQVEANNREEALGKLLNTWENVRVVSCKEWAEET